jgi:1-acyl-sn-glycerol-3-phosphate acyltransferase
MKLYFLAPLFFQKLIWIPTRLIFIIFGHIKIYGLENLKGVNNSVIFATNHLSEIDPFVVPASLPFWSRYLPLFYVTRERSFYVEHGWRKYLFGGWFINAWGGYIAQAGLHDYEKSLVDHISIAHDGGSFCIYPEGGITRDGTIQLDKAKGGIAYLAERGDCTIVPVSISGIYKTPFIDFFLGKRKIIVRFGLPITQEELQNNVPKNPGSEIQVYKDQAKYVIEKIIELNHT